MTDGIHHDTKTMLAISGVIGAVSYISSPQFSGERVHLLFALVTCLLVFLLQKLLHFIWDKFVLPKKDLIFSFLWKLYWKLFIKQPKK